MAMIDELVEAVARAGALPPAQASLAVGAMLRFMAARLPSPLFGELQSRLQAGLGGDPETGSAGGRAIDQELDQELDQASDQAIDQDGGQLPDEAARRGTR